MWKARNSGRRNKLESTFASGSVLIVGGAASLKVSIKGHPRGAGLRQTTESAVRREMVILVLETVHITK